MNFHLSVAAAKAALKTKATTPLVSPSLSASSTDAGGAPSTFECVHNNKRKVAKIEADATIFKIPQFSINSMKWDDTAYEDFPVDSETAAVRSQVLDTVNSCLAKQNAPSTIITYEALLKKEVGEAEAQLDAKFLPLNSQEKFVSLFGFLKLRNPDIKWSRVQALKSAIKKWHSRHHEACIFDEWTPVMQALWTGLSRSAIHASSGKEPIDFPQVMAFLKESSVDPSPALIRLRAMVAVGFFGVRRCAEILKFTIDDVKFQANHDFHLMVKCQKNDQEGIGMHCVIPAVESLCINSPSKLLEKWIECRSNFTKSTSKEEPLFCTVTGTPKNIGNELSPDSFRKALSAIFAGNTSTHSLRKGGARFYAAADTPEQATQVQGGWRMTEAKRTIYTSLTPEEVKTAIHRAANSAGDVYALQMLSKALIDTGDACERAAEDVALQFMRAIVKATSKIPFQLEKFVELKAGVILKKLTRHHKDHVRNEAIPAYTALRTAYANSKARNI